MVACAGLKWREIMMMSRMWMPMMTMMMGWQGWLWRGWWVDHDDNCKFGCWYCRSELGGSKTCFADRLLPHYHFNINIIIIIIILIIKMTPFLWGAFCAVVLFYLPGCLPTVMFLSARKFVKCFLFLITRKIRARKFHCLLLLRCFGGVAAFLSPLLVTAPHQQSTSCCLLVLVMTFLIKWWRCQWPRWWWQIWPGW